MPQSTGMFGRSQGGPEIQIEEELGASFFNAPMKAPAP